MFNKEVIHVLATYFMEIRKCYAFGERLRVFYHAFLETLLPSLAADLAVVAQISNIVAV